MPPYDSCEGGHQRPIGGVRGCRGLREASDGAGVVTLELVDHGGLGAALGVVFGRTEERAECPCSMAVELANGDVGTVGVSAREAVLRAERAGRIGKVLLVG